MGNLIWYYAEDRRFASFFRWLRATQLYGCKIWVPTCRWLQSTVDGRCFELVKWGSNVANVIMPHIGLTMNL